RTRPVRARRAALDPRAYHRAVRPGAEVEKALVQMRSPRPESTRGTLNITLAAHRFVAGERQGDEPMWQTFDRLVDELIRLRAATAKRKRPSGETGEDVLPGLLG
ncbi:MAG: hypothetical protein WCQ64_14460, partial [Acidobacteriota bacterium]